LYESHILSGTDQQEGGMQQPPPVSLAPSKLQTMEDTKSKVNTCPNKKCCEWKNGAIPWLTRADSLELWKGP